MNLAIIPARKGSKRIPNKNYKLFMGRPLYRYAVDAANGSGMFDEIHVSNDENRSAKNCGDNATLADVITEVLETIPADNVCCILPNPLVRWQDIRLGLPMLHTAVFTMIQTSHAPPIFQDAGQFYWVKDFQGTLFPPGARGMLLKESECQDINTEKDWMEAEAKYAQMY